MSEEEFAGFVARVRLEMDEASKNKTISNIEQARKAINDILKKIATEAGISTRTLVNKIGKELFEGIKDTLGSVDFSKAMKNWNIDKDLLPPNLVTRMRETWANALVKSMPPASNLSQTAQGIATVTANTSKYTEAQERVGQAVSQTTAETQNATQASDSYATSNQATAQAVNNTTTAVNSLNTTVTRTTATMGAGNGGGKGILNWLGLGGSGKGLGEIWKIAGGVSLATMIKQALQAIVQYFKQAIQEAQKFDRAVFTLQASIRAMQREGSPITMQGTSAIINDLKEAYKVFSTPDLVGGVSKGVMMLRQMKSSWEDLGIVLKQTAVLAVLAGQTYEETMEDMATAIATGYSRTIKRLGLAFGTAQLNIVSTEMYGRAFNMLDLAEKAAASATLIERQLSSYGIDVNTFAESYAGKIAEAEASLQDSKTTLGYELLPIWADIVSFVSSMVEGLLQANKLLKNLVNLLPGGESNAYNMGTPFQNFIHQNLGLGDLIFGLSNPLGVLTQQAVSYSMLKDLKKNNADQYQAIKDSLALAAVEDPENKVVKYFQGIIDILEDTGFQLEQVGILGEDTKERLNAFIEKFGMEIPEELSKVLAQYGGDLIDLQYEFQVDRAVMLLENEIKLARDLAEIRQDSLDRLADLEKDHEQRLEDIKYDYASREVNAKEDLDADLLNMDEDYQLALQQLEEDSQQELLDMENKFQNDLLSLRNKAFFDLEEAVRVGDARAAREILRKYRFDREEMLREQELRRQQGDNEELDRKYRLEREYLQRKARRIKDYNDQIEEYRRLLERKLEEEDIAYQKRVDEENERRKKEEDKRREADEERLRDLELNFRIRAFKMTTGYADLAKVDSAYFLGLIKWIEEIYGDNGILQGAAEGYFDFLALMNSGLFPSSTTPVTDDRAIEWYAKGGTFVAKRPTLIGVGESGDELVQVTPMADINRNINNIMDASLSTRSAQSIGGNAQIYITLSPDLRGRIIEDTLARLDSILESAERAE